NANVKVQPKRRSNSNAKDSSQKKPRTSKHKTEPSPIMDISLPPSLNQTCNSPLPPHDLNVIETPQINFVPHTPPPAAMINKQYIAASSTMGPPSFVPRESSHPLVPSNPEQITGQDRSKEASGKPSKRANKMRPNKYSNTPRNLCAREWVEKNHGSSEEFAAYFNSLPEAELEWMFTAIQGHVQVSFKSDRGPLMLMQAQNRQFEGALEL
ncbi:hypothetical protein CVT25_003206, partial [Psilocybe cyanescens]